ncbi:hypothetical protein SAMN06272771_0868 [Streptomyces sp. Ag82_O1-12]|uniref:hypothetical protein n=1 Tax=unclassified Streptomyces TaxID=2593676 RepID=UPI000BDB15CA|nr:MULTISPECIES: hypothetical protein [unclassified Streptomyces]SMQ14569.1 hypothetical protein SAMN06272771_0868 [Streptomyces sp. Ag82_O1-12]SOD43597.1 hypothetical protein SAMN06272727_0859 [Streptomyces sp. Ag82_G6-1]
MSARESHFREAMFGSMRLDSDTRARSVRLDLSVATDGFLRPMGSTEARASGKIRVSGLAGHAPVDGTMEISPLARRRIRYQLAFVVDNRHLTLDGWKSVSLLHPITSMTHLPFTLYEAGTRVGEGTLTFRMRHLASFLGSFRLSRGEGADTFSAPRWQGESGRTEVWYTTLTDPHTGTGVWLHHELVAPTDGSAAFAHGWAAVFPPDEPVQHERFGPEEWSGAKEGYTLSAVTAVAGKLSGTAGGLRWDLAERASDAPLFTFPRWSWRHPLLPAAHMLPAARATYSGTVSYNGTTVNVVGAPGASARIYGHGNGQKWAWLHADLDDENVLEVVAATSRKPGLRRLPPMVFLRLRTRGQTWPRRAERSAVGWAGLGRFRCAIGLPSWSVAGRVGLRRIRVVVTQPEERTLALDYADPDGSPATCHNSERADVHVVVERWWGSWRTAAEWQLSATAHAEVGIR